MIFFSFIFCTNFPWSQGEDILSSSLSKKGRFKVCKCYDIQRASIGVHFPWRCIWVLRYLKQFLSFFFSWAATMYETLTVDNLKNWHMVIGAWWSMCKNSGEASWASSIVLFNGLRYLIICVFLISLDYTKESVSDARVFQDMESNSTMHLMNNLAWNEQ